MTSIGVISDTHGLLRDEALTALEGSEMILHAGDVGGADVLERLAAIAPVRAVRGNTDGGSWADALPRTVAVELGPGETPLAYVIHELERLDVDPVAAGVAVVVYGHTHRPDIRTHRGVLYFNPGAAGHRRFRLPVTVGRLTVEGGRVEAEVVHLDVGDG